MSDSESDQSDQSDIVIKSALPKTKVKLPASPVDNLKNMTKKGTTKNMIHEALNELRTRKGVSLHAIKKYLIEKHNVDTEKINFLIKKTINTGVKDGSIIQVKGVGATGSFKLAPEKPKAKPKSKEKKDKPKKEKKTETEKPKKEKKTEPEKPKKKKGTDESKPKKVKPKKIEEKIAPKKDSKIEKKKDKKETKMTEEIKEKKEKVSKKEKTNKSDKKNKMAVTQTPVQKKAASIKIRRSIGNIIKPPKMNPKSTSKSN